MADEVGIEREKSVWGGTGEEQKRRWYKRHQHKNDGWGGGGERRAHKTGKWGGEKMYYVRTNTPQPRQEDKLAFAFSFHGPKEKEPSVERIDLPFLAVIFLVASTRV